MDHKAAEELFHRTLGMLRKDPSEYLTPQMKKKMTPKSLACMSLCGVSYFTIVGVVVFVCSFVYTIPRVCEGDVDLTFSRRGVGVFMFFGVVVNFVLVCTKRSFYSGGYSNDVNDFDKRVCLDCVHDMPPRVHHCPLCRRCVVKRDHHCFFTGCCVGFANQRYFLVYCFYCAVGCWYTVYYAWQYLALVHGHPGDTGYYNLILPLVIAQWLLGYSSLAYLGAVTLLCLCFLTAFGSTGIFLWQFFLAIYGTTSYEFWQLGGVSAIRPLSIPIRQNLYSVFGPCWFLNFIVPMTFLKQPGNGYEENASKVV